MMGRTLSVKICPFHFVPWISFILSIILNSQSVISTYPTRNMMKTIEMRHVFSLTVLVLYEVHSQEVHGMDFVDNELIAEILAEQEREEKDLEELEFGMRKLDDLKAKHAQDLNDRNKNKMKPGLKETMPNLMKSQFENIENELRKKESETAEVKRSINLKATEEAKKLEALQIAQEREAKNQKELEIVQDVNSKKSLKRQINRDNKIVRKILKQSEKNRHYSVLGLKCRWGEINLGPFCFCKISQGEVKKAYRNVAKLVHPDKNRDARAHEAFEALEKSAAILMDHTKKREYDKTLKKQRKVFFGKINSSLRRFWQITWSFAKILGPSATPISILLALII